MKNFVLFVLAGLLCCLSITVLAEAQSQKMTPEKCVELTHWLEKNPLDENARSVGAILLKYISDTPDFTVSLYSEFLGELLKSKKPGTDELTGQYMFGMAAFCCQHPDKKNNEEAKQMAGVQSMIRTYGMLKAQNPEIKIRFMEKLLKLQKRGKLESFVKKQTLKCTGK